MVLLTSCILGLLLGSIAGRIAGSYRNPVIIIVWGAIVGACLSFVSAVATFSCLCMVTDVPQGRSFREVNVGLYCDGSFHAPVPLMASSMELELDQSFEKLVTSVLPTIKRDFETVIRHLRPPKYPYAIDHTLATTGKSLFYSDEIGCYKCHGVYDPKGGVQWTGMHVDVGTDRARIELGAELDAAIAATISGPGSKRTQTAGR
jgi:hypothetical protein